MPLSSRFVALVALVIAGPAHAQEPDVPVFNAIRTPASPAFVLLGVEPTSIARPNTPADFAATVLNGTQNFSTLPRDFALEVSPYWLTSHPQLTWRDDVRRSVAASVQRTLTVAAGTAEIGTEEDPVTGLAVSVRAALASGRIPDAVAGRIETLERRLARDAAWLGEATAEAMAPVEADIARRIQAHPDSAQALAEEVTRLRAQVTERLLATPRSVEEQERLEQEFGDLSATREGLFVDVAGGTAWAAPDAVIERAQLSRWGGWVTASYDRASFSAAAVLRWLGARDEADMVDHGVRVLYTRDEYAISAEYVYRIRTGGADNHWRLAGTIDYRVTPTLWLTGVFGRDYDDEAAGSLLAQLGLSLQLSRDRYRPPE